MCYTFYVCFNGPQGQGFITLYLYIYFYIRLIINESIQYQLFLVL